MKKLLTAFGAASTILLASSAFAADANNTTKYEDKDNGGYAVESKTTATTPDGTDKKGVREVEVDVNDNGKIAKEAKTEHASDPKGLMNAKSDTTKTKYKQKDNGGATATTTVKHKDNNGTDVTTEVKTDLDPNGNGGLDKTVETTKKVDPKGLMNGETTTTTTVNGKIVK